MCATFSPSCSTVCWSNIFSIYKSTFFLFLFVVSILCVGEYCPGQYFQDLHLYFLLRVRDLLAFMFSFVTRLKLACVCGMNVYGSKSWFCAWCLLRINSDHFKCCAVRLQTRFCLHIHFLVHLGTSSAWDTVLGRSERGLKPRTNRPKRAALHWTGGICLETVPFHLGWQTGAPIH